MTKNKLEKKFSESWKADKDFIWGMKLHNNPLSHQNTPADYWLTANFENTLTIFEDLTMTKVQSERKLKMLKEILVECKQVTCDEQGKGRLAFKRLKQLYSLKAFHNPNVNHYSFFCIAYWAGRWDQSDVYLVPVEKMQDTIDAAHTKISLNREDAAFRFADYKAQIVNGMIDLSILKRGNI